MSLPAPLLGERFDFDSPAGRIACQVAGAGPPLLLVHSVNAAASAAEMRPLFEHARKTRTVYALDLPGYGQSERGDRSYSPRLMTDALHATAAQIRQRGASRAIDGAALSLGCEFLARAAAERPDEWRRLALVSPTGLRGTRPLYGPPGSTRLMPLMLRVLTAPAWTQGLFGALTRPGVVRYFLQRTWGGRAIDEAMWAYAVQTAAQPGARHAPLRFLAGALFSADITRVYESLPQPVWASHGVRGDFTDYRGLQRLLGRAQWQLTVFQTGALPYFEAAAEFKAAFDAFLDAP
jgi:pimeloyl-ACP methyl ester carboxylesterase